MGNKIVENETLYTFLLNSMYFNIARGEKRIFELWRLGENNFWHVYSFNFLISALSSVESTLISGTSGTPSDATAERRI